MKIGKETNINTKNEIIENISYYMMIDDFIDNDFRESVLNEIENWIEENNIYNIDEVYGPYITGDRNSVEDVRVKSNLLRITDKEEYRKILKREDPDILENKECGKFIKSISLIEMAYQKMFTHRGKKHDNSFTIIFSTVKL